VLFILIPLAWLAVVALFIAICQAAARGEEEPVRVIDVPSRSLGPGLLVWEESSGPMRVRRPLRRPRHPDASRVRSRQLAGHAGR
jgi:hypothetical protein